MTLSVGLLISCITHHTVNYVLGDLGHNILVPKTENFNLSEALLCVVGGSV